MKQVWDTLFARGSHGCPWWLCFTFDNYFRRFIQSPEKILRPYIKEGYRVLDIGPGMGYFTIPLAKMVGEKGQVIAADIQKEMLAVLCHRAKRAGVEERIVPHLSTPQSIGMNIKIDFGLAFWMLHEVPEQKRFLKEVHSILKPGALFLLAEPTIHVTKAMYIETIEIAQKVGFGLKENLRIFLSRSALFLRV